MCSPGKRIRPGGPRVQPEAGQPGSPLTDAGLARLVSLKSLRSLDLRFARITISGLSRLNALSSLTRLSIGDVEQDDTGMDISGLTKLEHLTIESAKDSQLRDEDLACLARLSNLGDLQIVGSNRNAIGDQGLAHLAGLTSLWRLSVASPKSDGHRPGPPAEPEEAAGAGHLRRLHRPEPAPPRRAQSPALCVHPFGAPLEPRRAQPSPPGTTELQASGNPRTGKGN